MADNPVHPGSLLRIGHRGAAGHVPPGNTLASIAAALRLGVDIVEIDLRRTSDGELIVFHDGLLQNSTTGSGWVRDHSIAEIQHLRTVPGDQPIPTLAEVLSAVSGHAGLMLEIKDPGTADIVHRAVRDFGFRDPLYYASFHHAELLRIRAAEPTAQTIALLDGVPVDPAVFALQARASHAGIAIDTVSTAFVRALHHAGLGVFAWTADQPEEIALARIAGVDGIISNFPDRIAP